MKPACKEFDASLVILTRNCRDENSRIKARERDVINPATTDYIAKEMYSLACDISDLCFCAIEKIEWNQINKKQFTRKFSPLTRVTCV